MCPGNNESAGKRISSKIRQGSPWLRRMACQSAWAAARTKNTYLSAQFKRLGLSPRQEARHHCRGPQYLGDRLSPSTKALRLQRPRRQLLRPTPRRRFKAVPGEASGESRAFSHTSTPNRLSRVFRGRRPVPDGMRCTLPSYRRARSIKGGGDPLTASLCYEKTSPRSGWLHHFPPQINRTLLGPKSAKSGKREGHAK